MASPRRNVTPETYRTLTLLALISLTGIVVTGAAVRLTGSGLGCADWPTCEQNRIVDDFGYHGWIEYGNRLITGVVSLAVIAAVLGSLRRVPRRRDLTLWSWGLVAGVAAQIVIGAIVVRFELDPRVVIAHFLISMLLVWNATVLHDRAAVPDADLEAHIRSRKPMLIWVQTVLTMAAMGLGTIVTGSGPHTGSLDEPIERLPFSVGETARLHSITVILLCVVAVTLWRSFPAGTESRSRQGMVLLALAAQVTIGYVQYFTGVPELLVAAHVLGASLLWIAVTRSHLIAGVNVTPEKTAVAAAV